MVISDSSTLIHLASIGRLALLRELFGHIMIPPAVWHEVVEEGRERSGAAQVADAHREGWIEIESAGNQPLLQLLKHDLDSGEAEVIALAVERNAELILLDESDARRIAAVYGLPKTGVVGILIRARQEGKIRALKPELDQLRTLGKFWMDEGLYQQALRSIGEQS